MRRSETCSSLESFLPEASAGLPSCEFNGLHRAHVAPHTSLLDFLFHCVAITCPSPDFKLHEGRVRAWFAITPNSSTQIDAHEYLLTILGKVGSSSQECERHCST